MFFWLDMYVLVYSLLEKKIGKLIYINFNFGWRLNLVRILLCKKGSFKKFWFMLFRLMEVKLWEKNDYLFYYYFW